MSETAKFVLGDKTHEFPVHVGTENEKGIDISTLRGSSGYVTYDVGYKNTGATKSSITYISGEEGILRYRGYNIEELANKASFLEVAYLLLEGELPTASELSSFEEEITRHTLVNEKLKFVFDALPSGAHPMGQLMTMLSMFSAYYPEALNPHRSEEGRKLTIIRLLAKMPTLVAMIMKNKQGHPNVYPKNKLGYVENFLRMTFGHVTEDYTIDPVVVSAMNKLLILHADHEQNCSTSAVRLVGSSNANLYASVGAGVAALWGPLHGGANQKVLEMLEAIKDDGGDTDKWLNKAKDKNDPFRLMGFGHRVYKNFDPRAKIIKKSADEILEKMGINDPILEIAKKLEQAALNDSYFIDRKLFPNVDFYSGIIYRALGFPVEMFTVLFALGRLPGWMAQWKELRAEGQPIGRPRQIYIGTAERPFLDVNKR
ncbi:MAG: citrate synthase [Chitinophagales bacterium]|nr:citrate synthase [Chitinophagales bacterium]